MSANLALRDQWLDNAYVPTEITGGLQSETYGLGGVSSTSICVSIPYWTYPVYVQGEPARPIKLKMSEVEALRRAARSDKKLKAILEKFTSQIEVVVDFE